MFRNWDLIRDIIKQQLVKTSPNVILVSLLSLAFFTSYLTYIFQSKMKQAQLEHKIEVVTNLIQSKIQSHIDGKIRPTQGLFIASQFFDHDEFAAFAKALQTSDTTAGITAVNYVIRLRDADLDRHIKSMKAEGFSSYDIWPKPKRKTGQDWFPVTYIYPMNSLSKLAQGFNVGQEEKRRRAMDLARDTGKSTITEHLNLIAEAQFGFIIFAPLYNRNLPVSTVSERRKALVGYISGALPIKNFINQLMQNNSAGQQILKFELYDGNNIDPNQLFYAYSSSGVNETDPFKENKNVKTVPIKVANGHWLARVSITDEGADGILYWFLSIVGILVSFLFYLAAKLKKLQYAKLTLDIELLRETKLHLLKATEAAETANLLKSAFLANMSHEIRTPISIIISSSDFLTSPEISEADKDKFTKVIHRNGKNLLSIVNDILDLSKIEAGMVNLEFVQTSIRSMLNDVSVDMQLLAQSKKLSFKMNISTELADLCVTDPLRLQQILRNIIGNAIKFSEKGEIEVTAEADKSNEFRILVKDSGVGLTEEQQKNLFKPFSQADVSFTRRYGGTGLGLVLSKKLAELLGGNVSLKSSQPGRGSVFEILVKNQPALITSNQSRSTSEANPKQLALSGQKILLVDDSPDNQFIVARILQMQGAEVAVAEDGNMGVEKALTGNFDLILMDIQMPVMDGFAATKILREKGYSKLIFALTAHTQPHLKELSAEAGFDNYLNKPFFVDELIRKFNL